MAVNRFRGDAKKLAQVRTYTIVFDAATTYTMTSGTGKAYSQVGTTDAATTAAALKVILAAALDADFIEITWTQSGAVITATMKEAGKPFTMTPSVAGGLGTFTAATVTANSGPSDVSVAGNWTDGLPDAADDVYFDEMSKADALYGWDAITAVALTSFNVIGYTKKLGLPEHTGSYREYRPMYAEIRATTINIDSPQCGRCKIDLKAANTTFNVRAIGSPVDQGQHALMVKGAAITTMIVNKGNAGLAVQAGETLTVTTLREGYVTNVTGDAKVYGGTGLTVGTIDKQGGYLELNAAVGTALTNWAGDVEFNGTGALAQLTSYGGTVTYNSTGALGGNTILGESSRGAAILDFSRTPEVKTVTNPIEVQSLRCRVIDPQKSVTSLVLDYNHVPVPGLDIGSNVRITRGTPA